MTTVDVDALRAQVATIGIENKLLKGEIEEAGRHALERFNSHRQLEAQVAALQEENERLTRERDESSRALTEWWDHDNKRIVELESELAAAQAKLAVPVPEDVQKLVAMTSKRTTTNAPHPNYPGHRIIGWVVPTDELDGLGRPAGYPREITHALEALARDNAALRTQAEALERERSERALDKMAENAKELGLDYDTMKPDGPLKPDDGWENEQKPGSCPPDDWDDLPVEDDWIRHD